MRYSTALKYLKHLLKERVADKLRWFVVMEEVSTSLMNSRGTEELGLQHNITFPYTPQHNGVAERKNRTIMDMARSKLKAKGMPNYFWAEAVTCAVYLINRSPTRSVPNTAPIEAWSGFKPNVQHLKVFG